MVLSSHNPLSSIEIAARLGRANEFGHPFLSYHESPEVVFMCHASAYLFKISHFRSYTSLRGRDVHDGTDYPNSLHGCISHTLQMTNLVSIPNHSLCVSSSSPSSKPCLLIDVFKSRLPQPMHLFSMKP